MNTDVAKIEQETKDMMTQIMSINKSIDHSKYIVGGVKDKEHSWLAKLTGKAKDEKIADLAVALGSTNVAVADLSKIVQKAMIMSQHSMIHSQTMTETISKMLSVGLQDENGRIVQLSGPDREIAKYILKSAESFTKNQEKIAGEFNKTYDQVGSLADRIEKIQREQNEFISAQQKKTKALRNDLSSKSNDLEDKLDELKKEITDAEEKLRQETETLLQQQREELEELKNKVYDSINAVESKVIDGVNQCENLIKTHKDEFNSQRDKLVTIVTDAGKNLRQETETLLQQQQVELEELKNKVKNSISIKEVDNKIANEFGKTSARIGGLEAHIGEIQEKQEHQQKIRLSLKKVFDIKYNNLEKKVKESEKQLQQQQEELEELKSQLQAKRKPHPLSIVTLIVSIAALLVAIITFCTGNSATDIQAPTPTTMEIETTTEVPAAQQ